MNFDPVITSIILAFPPLIIAWLAYQRSGKSDAAAAAAKTAADTAAAAATAAALVAATAASAAAVLAATAANTAAIRASFEKEAEKKE